MLITPRPGARAPRLPEKAVQIPTDDGYVIDGSLLEVQGRPIIVLGHGRADSFEFPTMKGLAFKLGRLGFSTFRPNFGGYAPGNRPMRTTTLQDRGRDLDVTIETLRGWQPGIPIAYAGHSEGFLTGAASSGLFDFFVGLDGTIPRSLRTSSPDWNLDPPNFDNGSTRWDQTHNAWALPWNPDGTPGIQYLDTEALAQNFEFDLDEFADTFTKPLLYIAAGDGRLRNFARTFMSKWDDPIHKFGEIRSADHNFSRFGTLEIASSMIAQWVECMILAQSELKSYRPIPESKFANSSGITTFLPADSLDTTRSLVHTGHRLQA